MKQTFQMTPRAGLVLEGGGMRGVFTCGVLDNLMDRGIRFPYTIGVSAGACNGLSYMSGQRGRARFSNIDLLARYDYIGLRHLWKHHNILDSQLLFHDFPQRILPYDYDALARCPERFEMVTTSCLTGKACYFEEKQNPQRIIDIAKASSSLPFVCPIAYVDGEPMLDGGIADSIPLLRAQEQGYDHCLVVLTRNRGYRKATHDLYVPPLVYRRYPKMREALIHRCQVYNQQLDLVERLEDAGEVTVIRPSHPVQVGRIEKDIAKLTALYEEGYRRAAEVEFVRAE